MRIAQCWRLYDSVGCALKIEKLIKTVGRKTKERLVDEPDDLKPRVSTRLGQEVDIFAFDPGRVEKAARRLSPDEVKTAADPFATARSPRRAVRSR